MHSQAIALFHHVEGGRCMDIVTHCWWLLLACMELGGSGHWTREGVFDSASLEVILFVFIHVAMSVPLSPAWQYLHLSG